MADKEPEGSNPPPQRPTQGPFPTRPQPAGSSGAFQGDAFQADAFQTTPSQPATPPVPKESSDPALVGGVDSGSRTITPGTARLDLGSGSYELKGTDLEGELTSADVRALARLRLRPVEAMLRDPLGDVARKERRSLLGISAIAILVGWTGLVPKEIQNFGITFTTPERKALLWLFLAVVLYYTVVVSRLMWKIGNGVLPAPERNRG